MDELRAFLNAMTLADREAFAISCGTTYGYLKKALSTRPQLDGALCRLIDENSGGKVPKASLRPDIWPELAKAA